MGVLDNKIAVVTGAGRGIGAATAKLLAHEGARGVLASRTKEELKAVGEEMGKKQAPDRVLVVPTNVSDEKAVEDLFRKTSETFGSVDILVNNAAVVQVTPVDEIRAADWDFLMNVNLKGLFLCSRE